MFADEAVKKVLSLPIVHSIIDVGCGDGSHSKIFADAGKNVYAVDIYEHPNIKNLKNVKFYRENIDYAILPPADCVWMSHVLEHQPNVRLFLSRMVCAVRSGGYIAITVPPAKNEIVGGHLTMWNAGLVMYNLIVAGTSCREVMIKKYGYNITVIVKVDPIRPPELKYDNGDIETLSNYFPEGYNHQGFNGDIQELNW